jgi:ATP-dependent RNA helicase DDX42
MGKKPNKVQVKGTRDDIEEADEQEEYFKWLEENPNVGLNSQGNDDDDDEGEGKELEYDRDGNIIVPEKNKIIDPLPPIDHSTINYEPFEKNFYQEHEEIAALTKAEGEELRKKLGIKVTGHEAPKPVCSFAHFNFDELMMKAIRKSEYASPTPIQAQAIPTALSGRDIIGIAKTGSGKTAAFIWPAIIHILDQVRRIFLNYIC